MVSGGRNTKLATALPGECMGSFTHKWLTTEVELRLTGYHKSRHTLQIT
jgi:hypothetical protein